MKGQKFTDAVVLGMGGSSLGPEVLAQTFASKSGFPKLHVLDSTDPAQVRALEKAVDIGKTLFIVSSKSGGTTEPNVMKDYFYDRVAKAIGKDKAGHRFIAVTDAGSSLEKVAKSQGFARVFHGEPTIGGRYSVLSPFGLVPAAAAGIDVRKLIDNALHMVRSCGADVPPHENPGVQLGLAMGLAGLEGRDKVTILSSEKIADFGAWAEQLIAESTGKDGKGLIPIEGEPLGDVSLYGNDRFFIDIRVQGDDDAAHDEKLAALEQAGHPVARIVMKSIDHIGQEFFRWEMATAVAGSILGINPFNQPDVESSKVKTRELTQAFEKTGKLPDEKPALSTDEADLYTDEANIAGLRKAGADGTFDSWLKAHLSRIDANDYVALLAYIERDPDHIDLLQDMRLKVGERRRVATCAEFGPRFLHSTGQAYKGGPDSGVFLQITADDARDLPVPGQKASFGVIKAAAARGDFDVLIERGRRALRVHLKGDLASGLKMLDAAIIGRVELEVHNATWHDRFGADGRQHRPPPDEARTYHRRLRQEREGRCRSRRRRRGRRESAGGFRQEAGKAAHRLGDVACRQDHGRDHRGARKTDGARRRHHRRRQHVLAGRRPPRQGAEAARHPLSRRRHLRRHLGHRARLLHDDRRREERGRPARPDLQGARARRRRHSAHASIARAATPESSKATSMPGRSAPGTSSR